MGVSQNQGYLFGGPYNKDYSILGSILGYPNFGKLPYGLGLTGSGAGLGGKALWTGFGSSRLVAIRLQTRS